MKGIDVAVTVNRNLFNVHLKHPRKDLSSLQLEALNLESLGKLLKQEGLTQVAATSGTSPVHEAI